MRSFSHVFFSVFLGSALFSCGRDGKIPTATAYMYPFQNPDLSLDERVTDLLSRLSTEEKTGLMTHQAQGVERLGVPYYNWWNEALHGVARSAPATVFPQAIGLAASFDTLLVREIATAISDEARSIYHEAAGRGIRKQYMGLTFWSPNVNIFRDPRWGRGHETYGEDPFLTGEIGAAFVSGLQGNDPRYLKTAACAKHFAVHNGPESKRHYFNAAVSSKDLYETYLPAFHRLVEHGVAGVMCAYNRTNDEVCCGSPTLLLDILRKDWNFEGYVVSDCGALSDFHAFHKVTDNPAASAALALRHEVNVNCGDVYTHLGEALAAGLITEQQLDEALARQLRIRFKLGLFDPDERVPYSTIRTEKKQVAHRELAREAARKSIVLLRNRNGVLPLSKDITQLYVTGNNAASVDALMGNYYGAARDYVTVLEGIAAQAPPATVVQYNPGIMLVQDEQEVNMGQLRWNTSFADAVVAVIGLSSLLEGEAGDAVSPLGGDREKIELPAHQRRFLQGLREACGEKPLIVVILAGSAIAMPEVQEMADAIIWAWYPGEQGGAAIADVLFGKVSPSGKLPVTMYRSTDQLGDFDDYRIAEGGRTYRYFQGSPLYPFGFGLGYSTITYSPAGDTIIRMRATEEPSVRVRLTNRGDYAQEEVVQWYVHKDDAPFPVPQYALKGFQRITLEPGAEKEVSFRLRAGILQQIDMEGRPVLLPGTYRLWAGGTSPGARAQELGAGPPASFRLLVE